MHSEISKQIVLFDDDLEVASYIKDLLRIFKLKHYTQSVAPSVLPEKIDLIIFDYCLPGEDGIEYLKILREKLPTVPVIMTTGHGSEDICLNAFRLGIKDYLKKPFSPSELRSLVYSIFPEMNADSAIRTAIPSATLNKFFLIKKHIDENICRKIELKEILSLACMSKSVFSRHFKEIFGISFKTYVLQKKIKLAKELIGKGFSVSEVAITLGFDDLSYFSKTFQKVDGNLPSMYSVSKTKKFKK